MASMKTNSALSLCLTVIFLVCCCDFTFGKMTSPSTCSLTATNNETLLAELVSDFDKDSNTVIIEYTINFNSDFDYSKHSAPNAFQPWKWYRTQGKYSSQLLLSYELYYGLLKNILYFNIKAVTVRLDVSPPSCFHGFENHDIEALVLNFLLKDFRIDGNTVSNSFTYSEDVEICTARLGDEVSWGALIYKCCGYDASGHMYCDNVAAKGWMLALIILIIIISSAVAICMHCIVPRPHRAKDYYYTPKKETPLEFIIKLEKDDGSKSFDRNKINFTHLKSMEEFYKCPNKEQNSRDISLKIDSEYILKEPKVKGNSSKRELFKIHVQDVHCIVPQSKLVSENKRTINFSRDFYDFFTNDEKHNKCKYCGRMILKCVIMFVLAAPSFPLAYVLCADGLWHREVAEANKSRGQTEYLYTLWRMPLLRGRISTGIVYFFYMLHCIQQIFFFDVTRNTFAKKSKHIWKKVCYWVLAVWAYFIFFIGFNFFLHVAVMIVTILVVQSSVLYEIIPIISLLIFYLWDAFSRIQNPFNDFMRTLADVNFFKELQNGSYAQPFPKSRIQRQDVADGTDAKENQVNQNVIEWKNDTLFLSIKEPFLYSNKFVLSKKFFLKCASVDYARTPGTRRWICFKAFIHFFKMALFIVFVFLVMMAFGHISFISPTSRTFLTFFAGLLPHILNKFSKSYKSFTKENFDDDRFQRILKERIDSFNEKWKVKSLYVDKITKVETQEKIDFCVTIPSDQGNSQSGTNSTVDSPTENENNNAQGSQVISGNANHADVKESGMDCLRSCLGWKEKSKANSQNVEEGVWHRNRKSEVASREEVSIV